MFFRNFSDPGLPWRALPKKRQESSHVISVRAQASQHIRTHTHSVQFLGFIVSRQITNAEKEREKQREAAFCRAASWRSREEEHYNSHTRENREWERPKIYTSSFFSSSSSSRSPILQRAMCVFLFDVVQWSPARTPFLYLDYAPSFDYNSTFNVDFFHFLREKKNVRFHV